MYPERGSWAMHGHRGSRALHGRRGSGAMHAGRGSGAMHGLLSRVRYRYMYTDEGAHGRRAETDGLAPWVVANNSRSISSQSPNVARARSAYGKLLDIDKDIHPYRMTSRDADRYATRDQPVAKPLLQTI